MGIQSLIVIKKNRLTALNIIFQFRIDDIAYSEAIPLFLMLKESNNIRQTLGAEK